MGVISSKKSEASELLGFCLAGFVCFGGAVLFMKYKRCV